MKKHAKSSLKLKFMVGTFVISIVMVVFYMAFLIPHSITTIEIVEEGIRDERITTYPLSNKTYLLESLKIFCGINVPNAIIILRNVTAKIKK